MKEKSIFSGALFAAILLGLIVPMTLAAHPPGSITFVYNQSEQTLTVTIVHETSSPGSHYINKVILKKNGIPAGSYTYQNQPASPEFSYSYKLPAKIGDAVEITASCNVRGSKTVKWVVQQKLS